LGGSSYSIKMYHWDTNDNKYGVNDGDECYDAEYKRSLSLPITTLPVNEKAYFTSHGTNAPVKINVKNTLFGTSEAIDDDRYFFNTRVNDGVIVNSSALDVVYRTELTRTAEEKKKITIINSKQLSDDIKPTGYERFSGELYYKQYSLAPVGGIVNITLPDNFKAISSSARVSSTSTITEPNQYVVEIDTTVSNTLQFKSFAPDWLSVTIDVLGVFI